MFSSLQEFVITGDTKLSEKQLRPVVQMIVDGYNFTAGSFEFTDDGRFVLYDFTADGRNNIDKENSKSAQYLWKLIDLYFATDKYKKAMQAIPMPGGDGSCYPGWRMRLDNSEIEDKIIIEPCWAFYHK